MVDPVTEADLHAFIDGQLETARRLEVEDHLSRHPEIAARVMGDLRTRDALVLAFRSEPERRQPARLMEAALRLERGLTWRRIGLRLRRAAAIVLLIGAGWFAHEEADLFGLESGASPRAPAFVEDARHSHQTTLIRARMSSQPETSSYDPDEILAETGIKLPTMPQEWRVADVQVFPSRLGHSVEVALDAGGMGRVSLFAARAPSFGVIPTTLARSDTGATAYWQSGELVYALTGPLEAEQAIERAAGRLSKSLR
ncbi:anti-sigma factor family protein [Enterovirga sp. CN4-39]|uniref:anti-sigma factor family protein n=1 Tax=Enterovirga sp. CN4-39 TaxID=3400910 RepID=UPI003C0C029B